MHWVFVAVRGLSSLVAASGSYSVAVLGLLIMLASLVEHKPGSGCLGFSSCDAQALELGLSSCGKPAQLLQGMCHLPGSGIKPVSPALASRFYPLYHQESPCNSSSSSFFFPQACGIFVLWPGMESRALEVKLLNSSEILTTGTIRKFPVMLCL